MLNDELGDGSGVDRLDTIIDESTPPGPGEEADKPTPRDDTPAPVRPRAETTPPPEPRPPTEDPKSPPERQPRPGSFALSLTRSALLTLDDEPLGEKKRFKQGNVPGGAHRLLAVDPGSGESKTFTFVIDGEPLSLGCWDIPTDTPCAARTP